jgi:hypothetical protein
MTRPNRVAAVGLALVLPLLAGCSTNSNPAKPDLGAAAPPGSDQAAIQAIVDTAPELDFTFADDGGELLGSAPAATPTASTTATGTADSITDSTAVLPVHWGRWRIPPNHPPVRTIEFLTPPDSGHALVRINVKFDGIFLVDTTDDAMRNPGRKPLRDQVTRYALFRKTWFHPDTTSTDSVFGWRLVAVSPSEFTMIDPSRQTVSVSKVELTGATTHVTITDPTALLSLRSGTDPLPLFREGEVVKVEATVTNTDQGYVPPTFVFLHVPIGDRAFPTPRERQRILMWDDGTHGDAVAGDGVYTAMWTVQDLGHHHLAVDVLNSRCLENETNDDYNSTTWGVPYGAYPSFLP